MDVIHFVWVMVCIPFLYLSFIFYPIGRSIFYLLPNWTVYLGLSNCGPRLHHAMVRLVTHCGWGCRRKRAIDA